MISKKYRLTPHCITTGLLIQSLVAPLVAVLYSYDVISLFWKKLIHEFGVFCVHISSTFIAVILIIIMLQKPLKKFWIIVSLVAPPLISVGVLASLTASRASSEGYEFLSNAEETLA